MYPHTRRSRLPAGEFTPTNFGADDNAPMDTNDVLLTPAEAAAESGFRVETIRVAYRSGDLRAFQPRPNGRVRIPRSALHQWLGRPAARACSEESA